MAESLIPLKHLARINERALPDSTDPDRAIRYLDIGSVGRGELTDTPQRMYFRDAPSRARRLVRTGDTIVSTVRTYLRSVWPVTGDTDDLVVSTGFAVLSPTDIDHRYFSWWLMSDNFIETVVARSTGVSYPAINSSELGEIGIRVPPLAEQRAIADYLDTETARIDALISKKRRLIELLAEHRTALITQTVTKGLPSTAAKAAGLPPNPPLKPTGIDWLGDIPTHWQVRRLGHVCRFAYGDSLPAENRRPGETPVYGSNGAVGYHNESNTSAPVIVVGRKGSHGQVRFASVPVFAIDTTYFVDERTTSADLRWLHFVLPCTGLDEESMDSAVPGLSREHAYGKRLPLPPLAEQQSIAAFLDHETAQLEALATRVATTIERLQEYRTALITAAVTGEPVPTDASC